MKFDENGNPVYPIQTTLSMFGYQHIVEHLDAVQRKIREFHGEKRNLLIPLMRNKNADAAGGDIKHDHNSK